MNNQPDPITKKELVCIDDIRRRISDLNWNEEELRDRNLVRWVRARNCDVDAIELMIRKNADWYKDTAISTVLHWQPPSGICELCPYAISGFDRGGSPMVILPLGKWEIPKVMSQGLKQEFLRMSLMYFEQVWTTMKAQSKDKDYITQFSIILDCDGLSWRQLTSIDTVDACLTVVRYFEANYPETVKSAFLVNTPSIFSMAWNLVKPFLSERTKDKIQIFGYDPAKWIPCVNKACSPEQYPEKYGGSASNSTHIWRDFGYINQNEEGTNL